MTKKRETVDNDAPGGNCDVRMSLATAHGANIARHRWRQLATLLATCTRRTFRRCATPRDIAGATYRHYWRHAHVACSVNEQNCETVDYDTPRREPPARSLATSRDIAGDTYRHYRRHAHVALSANEQNCETVDCDDLGRKCDTLAT